MKGIMFALAIGVLLGLSSCSFSMFSEPADVKALVLPNGVAITEEERDALNALTPEALAIQRSVAREISGPEQALALRHKYRDLLKSRFGDGWKKYTIATESSITFDGNGAEIARSEAQPVDPDSLDVAEASAKSLARVLNTGGTDSTQDYYGQTLFTMKCYVHNNWWWWGQNNDSSTTTSRTVTSIYVDLKDAATSSMLRSTTDAKTITTTGNWQGGFFPPQMKPTTTHRAVLKFINTVNGVDTIVTADTGNISPAW